MVDCVMANVSKQDKQNGRYRSSSWFLVTLLCVHRKFIVSFFFEQSPSSVYHRHISQDTLRYTIVWSYRNPLSSIVPHEIYKREYYRDLVGKQTTNLLSAQASFHRWTYIYLSRLAKPAEVKTDAKDPTIGACLGARKRVKTPLWPPIPLRWR